MFDIINQIKELPSVSLGTHCANYNVEFHVKDGEDAGLAIVDISQILAEESLSSQKYLNFIEETEMQIEYIEFNTEIIGEYSMEIFATNEMYSYFKLYLPLEVISKIIMCLLDKYGIFSVTMETSESWSF